MGRAESYSALGHITPVSYFYLAHALAEAGFAIRRFKYPASSERILKPIRRIKTVGADKGYGVREPIGKCRARGIAPHMARIEHRRTPRPGCAYDTAGEPGAQPAHRIEEIFGWLKAYGGLRKTRFAGQARVALHATLAAIAYNLPRMAKWAPPATPCSGPANVITTDP